MPLTNAEKQKRHRARRTAKLQRLGRENEIARDAIFEAFEELASFIGKEDAHTVAAALGTLRIARTALGIDGDRDG